MKPQTKEEGDLETLWSWMKVGGLLARPEEEARGLLLEVIFFLPSSFYVAFYYLLHFYPCTFLHLLGVGVVEESRHSTRRGPEAGG